MAHVETIFSPEKAKHVILYFLQHINNEYLGLTKLMKLLYYVDFDHYEAFEQSISGALYRKLPHGPYPKQIEKLLKQMEKDGLVQEKKMSFGTYQQRRLVAENISFNPSVFTSDELATIQHVAQRWAKASATEIEKASHDEAPWATTEDGKIIDYDLASYRQPFEAEPLDDYLAKSEKFAKYVAAL